VLQRDGSAAVFVVDDQSRARLRTVQAGLAMNKDRQIVQGLRAGEQVVVQPPDDLSDGSAVVEANTR